MARRSPPRFQPWFWLVPCAVSIGLSVYALRSNYLRMAELREAVVQADRDSGDVEGALRRLRDYVGSHMNTNLASGANAIHPPIQLKYTYERLTAKQIGNGGESVYTRAQNYCEQTGSQGFSGGNRVDCIQNYVTRNGGGQAAATPDIPKNLYQFDFATPRWSPDLAGFSLVAAAGFGLAFVIHSLVRFFRRPVKR